MNFFPSLYKLGRIEFLNLKNLELLNEKYKTHLTKIIKKEVLNMKEERKGLRAMKEVALFSTLLHFTTAARIPSNRFHEDSSWFSFMISFGQIQQMRFQGTSQYFLKHRNKSKSRFVLGVIDFNCLSLKWK